jgi:hypothetical protein
VKSFLIDWTTDGMALDSPEQRGPSDIDWDRTT